MAISVLVIPDYTTTITPDDVTLVSSWKSLAIQESIGQPDTLSLVLNELDDTIRDMVGEPDRYFVVHVYLDADILFSGLALGISRRNDHGVVSYTLSASGWEFLAPKRLVGIPGGSLFEIQEDGDDDRLPTPVAVDVNATRAPTVAGIQSLFSNYWYSIGIDTTTYVFEILPDPGTAEFITFSGTDIDGAMNDLMAAGSAAAIWWMANDAPLLGSAIAPHLALHAGIVALPDDGDDGDDLLLGFPSADFPVNVAPYAISDVPADLDFTTTIMAAAVPEIEVDHSKRVDAVYVRGATGWVANIEASGSGPGYDIGSVDEGGTGWVGEYGSYWGETYVDAPAAVTADQRDAFGNAYLGAYNRPSISGTIPVAGGWHGWHKGQALQVTDAGLGLDGRWLLIRAVTMKAETSDGSAMTYGLNVGDVLTPQLGYALRQQRLKEQRKEIRPADRFVPYVGDLQLNPGESAPLTMQLANSAGRAMAVNGVGAEWHLIINGVDAEDPEDTDNLFYLTDLVLTTDQFGQVTATLHAHADVTSADAVKPWCAVHIP